MRRFLFAGLFSLGFLALPSFARAQVIMPWNSIGGGASVYQGQALPTQFSYNPLNDPGVAIPPYSYYAATAYGQPARYYEGGYSNDFPFYGRPYGHVYDAYTFEAYKSNPAYPGRIYGAYRAW